MTVAIVGLGRIGRLWAELVSEHPDLALAATVDPDPASGATHRALDDGVLEGVDGVIVCTPTATHAAYVRRLLRLGKAVLCEKPLALDVADIQACFAEEQRPGQLIVALNRRWDPLLNTVRTGGGPVSIDCRDHPRPTEAFLRQSGGVFHDCLVHELDIVQHLLRTTLLGVPLVHLHRADGPADDADHATAATCVFEGLHRDTGCETSVTVRFCRVSDRYVHSVATRAGVVAEQPLPIGGTFVDRFRPAFAALLGTFARAVHGALTEDDLERIPKRTQCVNLFTLCGRAERAAGFPAYLR